MKVFQLLQPGFQMVRFLVAVFACGMVLLGAAFPVLAMESPRDNASTQVPQVQRKYSNNEGIRNKTEVEEPTGGLFSRKQENVAKGTDKYSKSEVNQKGARIQSQQTAQDRVENTLEKVLGDR